MKIPGFPLSCGFGRRLRGQVARRDATNGGASTRHVLNRSDGEASVYARPPDQFTTSNPSFKKYPISTPDHVWNSPK